MKRLTAISDVGEAYYPYCYRADTCDGEGETEKCRDCKFSEKICETLAAYENTGLTPQEIVQLKERDTEKAPSVKINDEAVKVGAITFGKGTKVYRCPNCKRLVIYGDRFCRDCGQRLKWEGEHERNRENSGRGQQAD